MTTVYLARDLRHDRRITVNRPVPCERYSLVLRYWSPFSGQFPVVTD